MSNILVRTLTGAVFISLVLIPLFFSAELAIGVFMLFMMLGLIEFYKLFSKNEHVEVSWELGLTGGIVLFSILVGVLLNYLAEVFMTAIIPLLFIVILTELWRKKKNPLINASVMALGWLYVIVPFYLIVLVNTIDVEVHELANDPSYFPLVAGMFILIWMNDTFAYLSGRFFGKTKLIERISPNKTWEGTIGGFLFTIAAGFAIGYLFDPERVVFWALSAVIVAPCAIMGDLLESLFKRNMQVKDSGNILPGHGGILDRFDATLFAAPFFACWSSIYVYIYL